MSRIYPLVPQGSSCGYPDNDGIPAGPSKPYVPPPPPPKPPKYIVDAFAAIQGVTAAKVGGAYYEESTGSYQQWEAEIQGELSAPELAAIVEVARGNSVLSGRGFKVGLVGDWEDCHVGIIVPYRNEDSFGEDVEPKP